MVDAVRFRPIRKDLSSRLFQHAQIRAEMRGCLQNLLRHSLLWHESCAAMGERGSQQIVARSLRAAQEMFGGRQRAGPRHTLTQGKREHMLLHTAVVRAHPPAVLVVSAEPGRCFIASSGACIPRGFTEHIPFPGYHIVFEYPTPKIRPTDCLNMFKGVQRLQHISLRCPTVVNKNHKRFPVCFIHTQPNSHS